MGEPVFWLGVSILLVAVCLAAVLVTAIPAFRELSRAARSAEKLFDTLSRELPPTLEAIRLTGMEISELTDEMNEGVQSASRVVQQVDQSVTGVRQQARQANVTTRSVFAGVRAAWRSFSRPSPSRRSLDSAKPNLREAGYGISEARDEVGRLLPSSKPTFEVQNDYLQATHQQEDDLQEDYPSRSTSYDWAESPDNLKELDALPPEPPQRVSDRPKID